MLACLEFENHWYWAGQKVCSFQKIYRKILNKLFDKPNIFKGELQDTECLESKQGWVGMWRRFRQSYC